MKHKVSELDGALLDAAVAKAEGAPRRQYGAQKWVEFRGGKAIWTTDDGNGLTTSFRPWLPSSSWQDGGPIIERERISVLAQVTTYSGVALTRVDRTWEAEADDGPRCVGNTPLIAAMRAYVASKFGGEVDLP